MKMLWLILKNFLNYLMRIEDKLLFWLFSFYVLWGIFWLFYICKYICIVICLDKVKKKIFFLINIII